MKIDVTRLEREPLAYDERVTLEPERLAGDLVASPVEVRLEGEVRSQGGAYSVTGRFRAAGELACSRCLEPVAWEADERFAVEYRRPEGADGEPELGLEEDEMEVSFFEGDEIDLTGLAVEQALLALPIRVLCRPSCEGLCPRCGANRNLPGACSCEPEIDPRWQGLAELAGRGGDN